MAATDTLSHSVITEDRKESVTTVQTVDLNSINHNYADPSSVLRKFSGVSIRDYGAGDKSLYVRGLTSQQVGVFLDGIKVTNTEGGTVNLQRFNLDNLECISLYSGSKTSVLQSSATLESAASVLFQTKRPKYSKYSVSYYGGAFNTHSPNFLIHQRIGKNYLSLHGKYYHTDGHLSNSKMDQYVGDINYFYSNSLLKVSYNEAHRGIPGSSQWPSNGSQVDRNILISNSYLKEFSKWAIKADAKYAYDFLNYRDDYGVYNYHQHEGYVSVSSAYYATHWLSVGIAEDVRFNHLKCDVSEYAPVSRLTNLLSANILLKPLDGFTMQGYVLYNYTDDKTYSKHFVLPSVHIAYKNNGFSAKAFYKASLRMPGFDELYYPYMSSIDLLPETNNQFNVDLSYQFNKFSVNLVSYWNKTLNKIGSIPDETGYIWTMKNYGKVIGYGSTFNVGYQNNFNGWDVFINGGYSYQSSQDATDKTKVEYKGQMPYIPIHSVNSSVSVSWKGWSVSCDYYYNGETYSSNINNESTRLKDYHLLDVSLLKTIKLWGTEFIVGADFHNILNQKYEVIQYYPMPGFNWNLSLKVTL